MTTRLFMVAGEASGDTHAARLIQALRQLESDLYVEGLGGEKMQAAGCRLRADLASSAVMGFLQVAKKFPYFRKLLTETKQHVGQSRPDALVLVDYPGFNLRLAATTKKTGIPVIYYISPQIWAWRPGRIHKIAKSVDKMIVILPFEEPLYRELNVDVSYVGHPLLDSIHEAEMDSDLLRHLDAEGKSNLFGLLPGSRKQEIRINLPVMLETAEIILKELPQANFLIPCSSQTNEELVRAIIAGRKLPVTVLPGKMYEVASSSRCCIVASGTATLEVGYFLTPLIVVYRTNPLAWMLAKKFLKVPHISLVNILSGAEVVPEMLQSGMRPDLLAQKAIELSRDGEARQNMLRHLQDFRERLGKPGASMRAAQAVHELLEKRKSLNTIAT